MDDILRVGAALAAGSCVAVAVVAAASEGGAPGAQEWLLRRARESSDGPGVLRLLSGRIPETPEVARLRSILGLTLARAGWSDPPLHLVGALALATSAVAAMATVAIAVLVSPGSAAAAGMLVLVVVPALFVHRLGSATTARRARLNAELAPVLELACLELSGGAKPRAALESVLFRSDCELARTLRTQLLLSRVEGSKSFEARLAGMAEELRLPALASLSLVLSLGRDYGSGVAHGLTALARDLRRVQRRALIADSRRALNRVLLPAAVGVLLPFMAILLFPALASLATSFQ